MSEFLIHEDNMPRLRTKLAAIASKCAKYGCNFTFHEVGEAFAEVDGEPTRFVVVEAEGVAAINGWHFVATLEHTDNGNIIKKADPTLEVPEEYRTAAPCCDHCRTIRNRKDTYLIVSETGEFKHVGKSCLKDFTGGMSAELIAMYYSWFDELVSGYTTAGSGWTPTYYEISDFLPYVVEVVRLYGYVKSSENRAHSTKAVATSYYNAENFPNRIFSKLELNSIREEMRNSGFKITGDTISKTKEALGWIREQEASNDYLHNLKTVCAAEYVTENNLGLLVSLVPTWKRGAEKKTIKLISKHVGNVKDKVMFTATSIDCVTSWETEWGWTSLYKILDTDGNVFIWKTSTLIPEDVELALRLGNPIVVKGAVKEHTDYNGVEQTVLTRCKLEK